MPERPLEALNAARRQVLEGHGNRMLRSLSGTYNCVGMVFANRRTCIEPDYVPMILDDDGYVRIERLSDVERGDVVVYKDEHGEVSHVGIVIANELIFGTDSTRHILVLSQFGRDGEYFHDHRDVPAAYGTYGTNIQFYSERRNRRRL